MRRGLAVFNRGHALEKDGACVEPSVHEHRRDARLTLAAHECPVDGRGTTVLRQQGEVYVDASEPRRAQERGRQYSPVCDDNRHVELALVEESERLLRLYLRGLMND